MVRVGDELFVSLQADNSAARWVKVGAHFAGRQVLGYDAATECVRLTLPDGAEERVKLVDAKIKQVGDSRPMNLVRMSGPSSKRAAVAATESAAVVFEIYPRSDEERDNAPLDWSFIDSAENPMRTLPFIPGDESLGWQTWSPAAKREFVTLYRQHGWKISVIVSNHGVSLTYQRIKRTHEN